MKEALRFVKRALGLCEMDGCRHSAYCSVSYNGGPSIQLCRECDDALMARIGGFR